MAVPVPGWSVTGLEPGRPRRGKVYRVPRLAAVLAAVFNISLRRAIAGITAEAEVADYALQSATGTLPGEALCCCQPPFCDGNVKRFGMRRKNLGDAELQQLLKALLHHPDTFGEDW